AVGGGSMGSHCEERSDAAISSGRLGLRRLRRYARNDSGLEEWGYGGAGRHGQSSEAVTRMTSSMEVSPRLTISRAEAISVSITSSMALSRMASSSMYPFAFTMMWRMARVK